MGISCFYIAIWLVTVASLNLEVKMITSGFPSSIVNQSQKQVKLYEAQKRLLHHIWLKSDDQSSTRLSNDEFCGSFEKILLYHELINRDFTTILSPTHYVLFSHWPVEFLQPWRWHKSKSIISNYLDILLPTTPTK